MKTYYLYLRSSTVINFTCDFIHTSIFPLKEISYLEETLKSFKKPSRFLEETSIANG